MDTEDLGVDDAVSKVMGILGKDGLLDEAPEGAVEESTPIGDETGAETPTDEESKPSETEKVEPETAIEPPASWRSDEKDLFKTLPREAQEIALRIQQASDSHFTQRSTELAQEKRATADERQQYQTERARYQAELGRLGQMASQLLPAKFQDIQSEADYLKMKASDPNRASEFEAFQMTLQMANKETARLQTAQQEEHLNREWQALLEKSGDEAKAKAAVDIARKTAREYYGFTEQEVQIIGDHRYVPILQDAAAWRQHQADLKAAQTKKTAPVPTKVLRQTATTGTTTLANDQKNALLNRARNATNDRDKATYLARIISAG